MDNGWIKLHRSLIGSRLWSCSDATFRVAVYLLLEANHAARWVKRREIKRGQLVRSTHHIGDACGVSRKAVRHALKVLERDKFIELAHHFGANRGPTITVCNYEEYQTGDTDRGQPGANQGSGDRNKNERREELIPPIAPLGPVKKKRLTMAEKKRIKIDANTEDMNRIGSWFRRKPDTIWTIAEAEALEQVNPSQDEIGGMALYYCAKLPDDSDYRRHNILTMLNNWSGELDRARAFNARQGSR